MAKQKPGKGRKNKKGAGGRPTRFTLALLPKVERLARAGLTDQEIADILGLGYSTFNAWKARYPKFQEALKGWKETANDRVERSLFERAIGYSFTDTKMFQYGGKIISKTYTKHVPPDTAAAFIWLKNRKADEWKDRHDETIPNATAEELAREIRHEAQLIDGGIPYAEPPNGGEANGDTV